MAYDIFISYRRAGGYETAKHLFDLLSRDGFSVSFDIDTLRNGDFDVELLKRVEECTDFILILNQGAFDRTIDPDFDPQKDWLRQELAHALKLGKNIIPIMLNGFTEFPDNLPADVARVQKKNGPKYDQYYFDGFYNKLVDVFLETPKPVKQTAQATTSKPTMGTLRIDTDLDCRILRFGKEIGMAQAGEYSEVKIPKGKHKLEFVGLENAADKYEHLLVVEDIEFEDYIEIKLLDKYNARRAKEEADRQRVEAERKAKEEAERKAEQERKAKAERDAYLMGLPDDEFVYFKEDGKYGYKLKSTREIAIPLKYDDAWSFREGLARVELNGKYGFIDKTGIEVIPLKYDYAGFFSEGLANVELNGKWGFIDKTGKEVISLKHDYAGFFSEGLAGVSLNGKWGFIDKTGIEVIPLKYDITFSFREGLTRVKLNGKFGFIDKTGKNITSLIYEDAGGFSQGLASVKLNNKWGFIDETGKEVIPLMYDEVKSFSEDLAAVRLYNKGWGFIDKTGNEVILLRYEYVNRFVGEKTKVILNGEWFYIDKNGNRIKEE